VKTFGGFMKYLSSLIISLLLIVSCNKSPNEAEVDGDFGIYLTADNILPNDLKNMDLPRVRLQKEPIIGINDIRTYERESHGIYLTESGVQKLDTFKAAVRGISFVVCVGNKPIYSGAFWTGISSISFDGVIIELTFLHGNSVLISLGYPTEDFYKGKDPRSDPRIFESLKRAGKLI
jgi:hypothetical protein